MLIIPHINVCLVDPDSEIEESIRNKIIKKLKIFEKGSRLYKAGGKLSKNGTGASFLIKGTFIELQKKLFTIIHEKAPDIINIERYPETNGLTPAHINTKGNTEKAYRQNNNQVMYNLDYRAFNIIKQ